jgi:hypothetical protein
MSFGFVLGNGVSRLELNLQTLKELGPIYGCNALYREFAPTVLVSTDKPISESIQHSGYASEHRMYTRKPIPGLGAHRVPDDYFGFSSGPIAVALAAIDQNRAVYLIGFDMGPVAGDRFNNVYADTEFYKKSSARPTYTGNWVRQLQRVCKDFSDVSFFRVMGKTTAAVAELRGIKNLAVMQMEDFQNRINNTKDL